MWKHGQRDACNPTDILSIQMADFINLTLDEVVKSQKFAFYVIPAKAGIDSFRMVMDSGSSPE
jgi:hypothetical protein